MVGSLTRFLITLAVATALAWMLIAAAPAAAKTLPPRHLVLAGASVLSPRQYLYLKYPDVAPQLDLIIDCESNWKADAKNAHSSATGLAQFLSSTWISTRADMGLDTGVTTRLDPYENLDAAVHLYKTDGPTQWECFTKHMI